MQKLGVGRTYSGRYITERIQNSSGLVFQWHSVLNKMVAILSKTIGNLNKMVAILFLFPMVWFLKGRDHRP